MSSQSHYRASDLFDLSFLTAVVTGGGTGIGLMISQALTANGAKVYITGRRAEVLEKTIKAHSGGPGQLLALPGDVSTKEGCLKLAQEIESKEPKGFQLLVNNAGIARDDATKFSSNGQPDMKSAEAISKHFLKSEEVNWDDTFRTNATAQFFMSMACLPLLAKGGSSVDNYSSQIVNVSSISGQLKSASGGQFSYGASKAASTHISRMLATTFKDCGVRVNVIAPGIFPSEMTTGESDEDNKSKLDKDIGNPAGRPGADSDMAATILLLAGRGGLFYNEQIMYPDGGATLASPAANKHSGTKYQPHVALSLSLHTQLLLEPSHDDQLHHHSTITNITKKSQASKRTHTMDHGKIFSCVMVGIAALYIIFYALYQIMLGNDLLAVYEESQNIHNARIESLASRLGATTQATTTAAQFKHIPAATPAAYYASRSLITINIDVARNMLFWTVFLAGFYIILFLLLTVWMYLSGKTPEDKPMPFGLYRIPIEFVWDHERLCRWIVDWLAWTVTVIPWMLWELVKTPVAFMWHHTCSAVSQVLAPVTKCLDACNERMLESLHREETIWTQIARTPAWTAFRQKVDTVEQFVTSSMALYIALFLLFVTTTGPLFKSLPIEGSADQESIIDYDYDYDHKPAVSRSFFGSRRSEAAEIYPKYIPVTVIKTETVTETEFETLWRTAMPVTSTVTETIATPIRVTVTETHEETVTSSTTEEVFHTRVETAHVSFIKTETIKNAVPSPPASKTDDGITSGVNMVFKNVGWSMQKVAEKAGYCHMCQQHHTEEVLLPRMDFAHDNDMSGHF